MFTKDNGDVNGGAVIGALSISGVFIFGFVCFCMWAYPQYNVYSKGLQGEAILKKAEAERKVLIEQAKAEKESAQLRADAIAIVGQAAKEFPEYRRQEFMGAFAEALQNDSIDKVIFVPTEANVPIVQTRNDSE